MKAAYAQVQYELRLRTPLNHGIDYIRMFVSLERSGSFLFAFALFDGTLRRAAGMANKLLVKPPSPALLLTAQKKKGSGVGQVSF